VDCQQIEYDETIEAYLGGLLAADERTAFEQHAFGCSRCLERLQVLRTLQAELWEQSDLAIAKAPIRRPVLARRWSFASAAALALLLIGAALWWQLDRLPGKRFERAGGSSALMALSAFEPPAYLPLALRGGEDEAAELFRTGMEYYTAGRFEKTIEDLRTAETLNPKASNILFFLGVSYLLTGETDQGISRLEKAASLGDPVYADEARFYLAKGWLRKGDMDKARIELETVATSGSRLAEEAARLLEQIAKSPSR